MASSIQQQLCDICIIQHKTEEATVLNAKSIFVENVKFTMEFQKHQAIMKLFRLKIISNFPNSFKILKTTVQNMMKVLFYIVTNMGFHVVLNVSIMRMPNVEI